MAIGWESFYYRNNHFLAALPLFLIGFTMISFVYRKTYKLKGMYYFAQRESESFWLGIIGIILLFFLGCYVIYGGDYSLFY
jgi:phosphate starvation-inducible membrane PsiE